MTKDIQRTILRACARFIGKKVDPISQEICQIKAQLSDTLTKEQADQLRKEWEDKLTKPALWFDKSLLPEPVKGEDGKDGKDADPIAIADVVAELLGTDGLKTLVDMQVAESIAEYFKENPVQHGKDGEPGPEGPAGPIGDKGLEGKDGLGLADAMIDREGALILTMTDGRTKSLGQVVGKDGDRGKDGADGLGFEDADITYDGERGFTIKWQNGDRVKEKTFQVPTIIDRGYWREGAEAKTGDAMTHNGTLWIALCDTTDKPSQESGHWRIGARKGRDGLQGPAGKDYKPPEPVKLGAGNG